MCACCGPLFSRVPLIGVAASHCVRRRMMTRNREGKDMGRSVRIGASRRRTAIAGAVLLVIGLIARAVFAADPPAASSPPAGPAASLPAAKPSPPEQPIRTRRPSFEYEQCANFCQMERDHGLTACLVADNPNKPDYPKPADCSDGGRKQYLACIAMCPADVGAPDQP